MIRLNFHNVEKLIFEDAEAQRSLPAYFSGFFESWRLGRRVPALRQLAKTTVIDFLNHLKEEHLVRLADFLGDQIVVERLNYSIAVNLKIPLSEEEICKKLCEIKDYTNYCIWRDESFLYLSLWR